MKPILTILIIATMLYSCTMTHRLEKTPSTAGLALGKPNVVVSAVTVIDSTFKSNIVSVDGDTSKAFILEKKIGSNGESEISVNLERVYVVTRTKTVAERMGEITIDFIISIPVSLQNRNWGVYFTPMMIQGDTQKELEKIVIRGELFSELQSRQYWQFNKYLNAIMGIDQQQTASNSNALISRYYEARKMLGSKAQYNLDKIYRETIKYPYANDSRLDSVMTRKGLINYYYTQTIKTSNSGASKIRVFFNGKVDAIDNSSIALPTTDTLDYVITSMISLVDTTTLYKKVVIERRATVNDKYMILFAAGKSAIIDTMANNSQELEKMKKMFNSLLYNYEYTIDSITLTSSGSPDGAYKLNERLAKERAQSVKQYLSRAVDSPIDTLIKIRCVAEDWKGFERSIMSDNKLNNIPEILSIIVETKDLDNREAKIRRNYPVDYKRIKDVHYPSLRTVSFKYDLARVGMVKDTVITNVVDTIYAEGVRRLKNRDYIKALDILYDYKNYNTAIVYLSLGYDDSAYEILSTMIDYTPRSKYMLAITCARLGKLREGLAAYNLACELDPILKFRSNLDPEIQLLLKSVK